MNTLFTKKKLIEKLFDLQIYTSAANMILLNGTIIVDTFFLISGFLSCYLMLLELDKKKKVNVPLLYAYRYIR